MKITLSNRHIPQQTCNNRIALAHQENSFVHTVALVLKFWAPALISIFMMFNFLTVLIYSPSPGPLASWLPFRPFISLRCPRNLASCFFLFSPLPHTTQAFTFAWVSLSSGCSFLISHGVPSSCSVHLLFPSSFLPQQSSPFRGKLKFPS